MTRVSSSGSRHTSIRSRSVPGWVIQLGLRPRPPLRDRSAPSFSWGSVPDPRCAVAPLRLGVAGAAEAAEDLPADRVVPVTERVADDARAGRPRSAAQHLVL